LAQMMEIVSSSLQLPGHEDVVDGFSRFDRGGQALSESGVFQCAPHRDSFVDRRREREELRGDEDATPGKLRSVLTRIPQLPRCANL